MHFSALENFVRPASWALPISHAANLAVQLWLANPYFPPPIKWQRKFRAKNPNNFAPVTPSPQWAHYPDTLKRKAPPRKGKRGEASPKLRPLVVYRRASDASLLSQYADQKPAVKKVLSEKKLPKDATKKSFERSAVLCGRSSHPAYYKPLSTTFLIW